jgi:hypothetical protein
MARSGLAVDDDGRMVAGARDVADVGAVVAEPQVRDAVPRGADRAVDHDVHAGRVARGVRHVVAGRRQPQRAGEHRIPRRAGDAVDDDLPACGALGRVGGVIAGDRELADAVPARAREARVDDDPVAAQLRGVDDAGAGGLQRPRGDPVVGGAARAVDDHALVVALLDDLEAVAAIRAVTAPDHGRGAAGRGERDQRPHGAGGPITPVIVPRATGSPSTWASTSNRASGSTRWVSVTT